MARPARVFKELNAPAIAPKIAVVIPCYNEELTIADVVLQFRDQLPEADIYVFDNNSTDRTVERAREAGALIYRERRQGKGYVVQSMFSRVDADVFVMVDGDGTYPPAEVRRIIEPVLEDEADMVVGSRLDHESRSQFRFLNRLGNKLFLWVLNLIFKVRLRDILSGYRAFNRKFVKNIPLFGGGFEIETELTIKALERGYRIEELPVDLGRRPEGSHSKIKLLRDGWLILSTIFRLFRDYKPLAFFGSIGMAMIAAAFIPGTLVIYEFIETGLVPRLPSAVLAVGMVLSGMLLIVVGLVLHTIARRFNEIEHQLISMSEESRASRNTKTRA